MRGHLMDGMNITGTPADNTHDIKREKFNLPEAKLPSIMMGQKETSLNDKLNEPLAGWTVEKSGETIAGQETATAASAETPVSDNKPFTIAGQKTQPENIPEKTPAPTTPIEPETKTGSEFTRILEDDNEPVSGDKYKLKDSDLPSDDTYFYNGSYRSRTFNVDDLGWSILNRRNNNWNDKFALLDSTVQDIDVKNKDGETIAGFKDGKFFVKDKEVSMEKFQRYTRRRGDTLTVNYNPVLSEIEQKNTIPKFEIKDMKDLTEAPDLTKNLQEAAQRALEEARPKGPTKKITAEVVNKIKEISERLHCNPQDLMAVINAESGFNPQARNKRSGATGLIQFMPRTARGLGTSTEELSKMSTLEQLDFVEKYLKTIKQSVFSKDHELTGAELYALIYLPKNAAKDALAHEGTAYYNHNRGLDRDKDGVISKNDLAMVIQSKYIDVEIV